MRRQILVLLLGVALASSACAARGGPERPAAGGASSSTAAGSARSASGRSAVVQVSDTLFSIRLGSGEVVEFADSYGGTWETTWAYRYEGYLDRIGAHLISVRYYEGGSFILIGAERGDTTVVDSRPVVSPAALHFITASSGGDAGYDPTRIQIWRIAPGGFNLAFSHETEDWGFSHPIWQREDSVTVVRHIQTEEVFPGTIQDLVSVVLRDGSWMLIAGDLPD